MQFISILLEHRVKIGSVEHFIPILLAVGLGYIIFKKSKKFTTLKKYRNFNVLGILISATVLIYHLYHICFESYSIQRDLPLYLCSLMALIIPVFTYSRKYWMFEILVFWIIAGTIQGVVTPDIAIGFPSFDYFRYWIVHLGLLLIIFYAIRVLGMKPKFKSVFKSFFALQIYVVSMIVINYALNANYFYLNKKPESTSILDYFGEWPYYIIVCQLIIIPMFLLIYAVFVFFSNRN